MFLGTSPQGVEFPHSTSPAHLVFCLLSPMDRRYDHLRILTEVARMIRQSDDLESLRTTRSLSELYDWFSRHGNAAGRAATVDAEGGGEKA